MTATYTIHRNNRRFNNKSFSGYEAARSYVRKWLRKNRSELPTRATTFDYSLTEYRNPAIDLYGFSVKCSAPL